MDQSRHPVPDQTSADEVRKRRNRRIAAGVVGSAVLFAAVGLVRNGLSLDRSETSLPGGGVTGPAAAVGPAVVDPLTGLTPTSYDPSLAEMWPGGSIHAGAYSFLAIPEGYNIHNLSGLSITWDLEPDAGPESGGTPPLTVTLAGHDAIYQRISAELLARLRGASSSADTAADADLWVIDLEGTKVRVILESPQNAGAEELQEAYEIIASIQVPPQSGDLGHLTFWVPLGWDSK
jgi:hypothetical protein